MPKQKKKEAPKPAAADDPHPAWCKLKKPPKDINAPKRPPSAYFIFSHQKRQELRQQEEYKTQSITALSKVIAAEWKKLTPDQKKTYEEQAREKKRKYDIDLGEYKTTQLYKQYHKRKEAFDKRIRSQIKLAKKKKEKSI
eukprot:501301_1